jgi:hypothetical protein
MSSETPRPPKKEAVTPQEIAASLFTGAAVAPVTGADDAIDLSAIPRAQWDANICTAVILPPDVAKYVAGLEGKETVLEKDHIEERVMAFYGVTDPFTIVYRSGRARLMRND